MSEPYDPRELLPHAGPMMLLSRVLRHDGDETACSVEIDAQQLFREDDGSVPAWVGLEYMAQCIAVHMRLATAQDGPPRIGFLASVRGLSFHCEHFAAGQRLEAVVRKLRGGGEEGFATFGCRLFDAAGGAVLAEGRISCFAPAADGAPAA